MKIYLMRHGETDWNKARRLQGQSDIPLNEFGMELAEKTAEGLKGVDFEAVFSSPLKRAYVTARIVVGNRNVPVITDDRLKEVNFGAGEGEYFDPIKQNPEHPLYNFLRKPECYVPTGGGESIDQVKERAEAFLREKLLPLEGSCENVLVVAHGALNRCILSSIAGSPDSEFWKIGLPNCAVSILSLENGRLHILEESKIYYDAPVNARP